MSMFTDVELEVDGRLVGTARASLPPAQWRSGASGVLVDIAIKGGTRWPSLDMRPRGSTEPGHRISASFQGTASNPLVVGQFVIQGRNGGA